eukprot:scaffold325848_cov61-Tisochrysis_lutea.AAC.2
MRRLPCAAPPSRRYFARSRCGARAQETIGEPAHIETLAWGASAWQAHGATSAQDARTIGKPGAAYRSVTHRAAIGGNEEPRAVIAGSAHTGRGTRRAAARAAPAAAR